ncbi:MAG: amidohydrolase family protein [Pyrinomonadaceae bacterium]
MLQRGVHMTTLAPEIEGGIELIEALVAEGWVVSIGHTRADLETLDRAYAAGARHITHFFNAMTGVHHREVGVAGWGLANEGVTFDIIADGIHVHPEMLGVVCRSKSPDKVSLISDSVAPTGLGDGEFQLWGETITVKNGRTRNERGSIAGSVIAMDDAVRMMLSVGFSQSEVAQMASTNPAKLLGIDNERGSLDVGKRADFVALDPKGKIAYTVIGGVKVEL